LQQLVNKTLKLASFQQFAQNIFMKVVLIKQDRRQGYTKTPTQRFFLGGNANEEIIELFIFVHFVPIAVHVSMYIEHAIPLCISLLYVVYVNV
jgi:hypothetical protein